MNLEKVKIFWIKLGIEVIYQSSVVIASQNWKTKVWFWEESTTLGQLELSTLLYKKCQVLGLKVAVKCENV